MSPSSLSFRLVSASAPESRLIQTTIDSYFACRSGAITQRKTTSKSYTTDNMLLPITEDRRLHVEIFSDDESDLTPRKRPRVIRRQTGLSKKPKRRYVRRRQSVRNGSETVPSLTSSPSLSASQSTIYEQWKPQTTSTPVVLDVSSAVGNKSCLVLTKQDLSSMARQYLSDTEESTIIPASTSATVVNNEATTFCCQNPEKQAASASRNVEVTPKKIKVINQVIISPESPNKTLPGVKPEQKLNFHNLDILKKFLAKILNTNHLKCLLSEESKDVIMKFFVLDMDKHYQYLCIKLFTWKPLWYNIFKYAKLIKLNMNDDDVLKMYNSLKDAKLVDTDYSTENLGVLLNHLDLKDLKDIQKKFKLTPVYRAKDKIIGDLLKNCSTQRTLPGKSMDEVLRKMVEQKMGFCVRMNDKIRDCFHKILLLNTYANSNYASPEDYFRSVSFMRITYPNYKAEDYSVFYTREEFERYAEAQKCRNELDKAQENKNLAQALEVCKVAFDKLQNIDDNNSATEPRPEYLERFTATSKYRSVLIAGAKFLTPTYFKEVKEWLEFLISSGCTYKRGFLFKQLLLIETVYFKNYLHAAERLIAIVKDEGHHFSEIDLHNLANRGRLLNKKTHKIDQLIHDQIVELSPPPCDREWPTIMIDRHTMRDNQSGFKRKYVIENSNGARSYLTVEELALDHYLKNGFTNGNHYENSLISALFCLLFYDIIYEHYVEGVFVCDIQETPLDMYTPHFYRNRSEVVDRRLQAIQLEWTNDYLNHFLTDNYAKHSHESCLAKMEMFTPEVLCAIVECLGRGVLASIFKRLVVNYREYCSGFPDLFLWNTETKQCKFVEVKGEKDNLSIKQKLWLNYLMDFGAQVEVCHVHSIGSKKRNLATKKKA